MWGGVEVGGESVDFGGLLSCDEGFGLVVWVGGIGWDERNLLRVMARVQVGCLVWFILGGRVLGNNDIHRTAIRSCIFFLFVSWCRYSLR